MSSNESLHCAWAKGVTGIPCTDNAAIDINKNNTVKKKRSQHNRAKKAAGKAEIIVMLEEIQANNEVIMSRFQTTYNT